MSPVHYDSLDLLKAIAIFFVVLYHFNSIPTDLLKHLTASQLVNYWFKALLSCCVPVFFFVNGALLLNKPLDVKKHYLKTLKIIPLCFLWGAITLFVMQFAKHQLLTVSQFFTYLWAWKSGWINHLWFLQALFVVYALAPLIALAFQQHRTLFYIFFGVLMIFTFGNTLLIMLVNSFAYCFNMPPLARTFNFFNSFHPFRGIYGYTIGYFMLGGIAFSLRNQYQQGKHRIGAVIVIALASLLLASYGLINTLSTKKLFDVVFLGYDTLCAAAITLSLFVLSLNYTHSGHCGLILQRIAQNSLGIYLVHRMFGFWLQPYFLQLRISTHIWSNVLFALLLLFLSLGVCLVLRRVPGVKLLFSL